MGEIKVIKYCNLQEDLEVYSWECRIRRFDKKRTVGAHLGYSEVFLSSPGLTSKQRDLFSSAFENSFRARNFAKILNSCGCLPYFCRISVLLISFDCHSSISAMVLWLHGAVKLFSLVSMTAFHRIVNLLSHGSKHE